MGASEEAHRDALWVITVVGGLSLTKALEEAIPKLSLWHWSLPSGVTFLRLFVFLTIALRLFIGANVFFQHVHLHEGRATRYPKCNYVVDFASAILHFGAVYWMALQITSEAAETTFGGKNEQFFFSLCAVLLYDWAWMLLSSAYTTKKIIMKWAITNTLTLLPCSIAFILFGLGWIDRAAFEICLAVSVFLFGLPDMIRLAQGTLPD